MPHPPSKEILTCTLVVPDIIHMQSVYCMVLPRFPATTAFFIVSKKCSRDYLYPPFFTAPWNEHLRACLQTCVKEILPTRCQWWQVFFRWGPAAKYGGKQDRSFFPYKSQIQCSNRQGKEPQYRTRPGQRPLFQELKTANPRQQRWC